MRRMPTFPAADGTSLAYHVLGEGDPVICLPGGPMQDSAYLGDLGGLSAHRQLIMMDLRGTGDSGVPADPASYRCDRLVGDVEALRQHLGLDQVDLLAHSAGTNLAVLYAARYPERVRKLALITPSQWAVGIDITTAARREIALLSRDESWFTAAFAAMEAIWAGQEGDDSWRAVAPFFYGKWDAVAQAHMAASEGKQNEDAAAAYGAEGAYDPAATRAALAAFGGPVLLLAGEIDLNSIPGAVAEYAGLFADAELVVQPGAGHYPWLADGDQFVAAVADFLG
jgi:pimeloyl-ACP methyl ester carboxylesterase